MHPYTKTMLKWLILCTILCGGGLLIVHFITGMSLDDMLRLENGNTPPPVQIYK